jgi:hypothetical protein
VLKSKIPKIEIENLYKNFNSSITNSDCGLKCSPYNEGGKPFCCDICHAVPTAYDQEWNYLKENTSLWFPWTAESCLDSKEEAQKERIELESETPDNMVLIECLGPASCERDYRTFTCRQFPFFPYIDSQGNFIGISYYWEYEEHCWVISNLAEVTKTYLNEFIKTYDKIFILKPKELENYQYHSERMRDTFNEKRRAIPILHRNGSHYKITTHNERIRKCKTTINQKFGFYKVAQQLPFLDEII